MQHIIPAINCSNAECFSRRLSAAREFLPKGSWLHIDVSDSSFANTTSFISIEALRAASDYFLFSAHLMLPSERMMEDQWFSGLFSQLLVHPLMVNDWDAFFCRASDAGVSVGVVVGVGEEHIDIPDGVSIIEVLAVSPGASGQSFDVRALSTLSALRKQYPDATLLVDGGVEPTTARLLHETDANVLISGSFVWSASDPHEAYRELETAMELSTSNKS